MPDAKKSSQQDIYAEQLVEALNDVVDILNDARIDGIIFNFQIANAGPADPFRLVALSATKPIVVPPANGVVGEGALQGEPTGRPK
jgi:hypothetical protein